MSRKYEEIQPGGSLVVAWQVYRSEILIVGGGEVAASRIIHCLNADAFVTIVCPKSGLCPEVAYRIANKQVRHVDRVFQPSDLDGVDMVLVAVDDPAASTVIWKLAKKKKLPANIADVPSECDFYFGSVHRDGPLQIMISTNGRGPRMSARLRKLIAKALPENIGQSIESLGRLREKLRALLPDNTAEASKRRMKWISKVSDQYSYKELSMLDDEDLGNLLLFFPANKVPSFYSIKALREEADFEVPEPFDGSFGFHVGL